MKIVEFYYEHSFFSTKLRGFLEGLGIGVYYSDFGGDKNSFFEDPKIFAKWTRENTGEIMDKMFYNKRVFGVDGSILSAD